MNNDPWKDLPPPSVADAINAKRVNADIQWDFFWARDINQNYLLILKHSASSTPQSRLPKLKGIELIISESTKAEERLLILRLLESAHREIFLRLCSDIVAAASRAASERAAVEVTIARTWRWHHLLRGGRDDCLSPEEQKGLIGELLVLEHYLLPKLAPRDAVSAWHGPLGAPKDFEIGRVCIESKARRGAATPYIYINSEYQLDDNGTDALFLYIVELDKAHLNMKEGFTVTEVAARITEQIAIIDQGAVEIFEDLLSAAGFRWEDDYSDFHWIEGPHSVYRVSDGFPRITAQTLLSGVSDVKYSISIIECGPFSASENALVAGIERGQHGN